MRLRALVTTLFACLLSASSAVLATADVVDVSPPGANDWSCKPTAEHPDPVVLVHGTFENMAKNWSVLSPRLAAAGFCVFALNYGNDATAPVADSARELAPFVDAVRGVTGARKVDDLVGIVPSNHGTTNPLAIPTGYAVCPACRDQVAGSAFLTELNAKGDTVAGPHYTVVTTRYDEVVTPYTSAFLSGPAKQVTNVTLQDACPLDVIEHDQSPNDPVVAQWVIHALSRTGPADPLFRPTCL